MGKGWTIAARFAEIDRRRMGALAVLVLEVVLVSFVLSYNYGYSSRNSTDHRLSATSTQRATDPDWFAPATAVADAGRVSVSVLGDSRRREEFSRFAERGGAR